MELMEHQLDALRYLKSGSVLHGGVGSGKSLTAIAWHYFDAFDISIDAEGGLNQRTPLLEKDGWIDDLVIITTAKKRDTHEWIFDLTKWYGGDLRDLPFNVHIDSWNNIKKYVGFKNAYFIFDEQRLVGYGTWTKSFLKIARCNKWILLTATPGDTWLEYMPVMIANGYYLNKSDFIKRHVVYNPYVNFPCVQRYVDTGVLKKIRNDILVEMPFEKHTDSSEIHVRCSYDRDIYKIVEKERFNPYTNWPIENVSEYCVLLRKVCGSHPDRIEQVHRQFKQLPIKKVIIFYNYNYELELLREWCLSEDIPFGEWNGQRHTLIPEGETWVYLVQYAAGNEGWNCVETPYMFFYSMTYSYKMFKQAKGRIDRMNTPFTQLVYYIFETDSSIDQRIKKCIQSKKDFNEKDFVTF